MEPSFPAFRQTTHSVIFKNECSEDWMNVLMIYCNIECLLSLTLSADMIRVSLNRDLMSLELYEKDIQDEGAIAIADALKVNATLTMLNLSHNDI
jgi:hypothetical protein